MQRSDSLMSEAEEQQKLQIFVSCRRLDDLDLVTVTDSYLVVKLLENNRPEKVVLKTKVYWNDLNPNYAQSAIIDFFFQIKQKLIFQVYHYETPPKLVGRFETSVGEIFGSREHGLIRDLKNGNRNAGKIIVRCQKEQKARKQIATLKFSAQGLPNIKWWFFFGGTNAFFRIFRRRQNDELLIYQSQQIQSTNPAWLQFKMSQRRLASNDPNKQLQLRVYNYNVNGNHEVIGSAIFRLRQLRDTATFDILSKSKNKVGTLVVDKFTSSTQYQFTDFIENGLQLSLVTCIDFTASNGVINDKKSLHYVAGLTKNPYEKALQAVTNILLDYDYDKLVPTYGFGAKVRHPNLNTGNQVHHCFPINGNVQNPNLYKLQEILREYRKILPNLQFSGPTKFTQLLKESMKICRDFKILGNNYMILLILTDGQIHDLQEVIDLLIKCNRIPMSIIIVGIGEGNFGLMHELDDDNCEMADSRGNKTQRDLVQFVEFQKFSNNGPALAKQVLEELPRQVSQYFQLMNITPQNVKSTYKVDDIERVKKFKEEMINPYMI